MEDGSSTARSVVIAVRFSPSANSRQATLPGALPRIALQPCDMFSRILARSWNPVMALLPQCGTAEDAIHFLGGLEPPNT